MNDKVGAVALRPRDVRFDFSGSPLHWIPGEPVASHAISGLNLILPLAERGFVEMFRRALPYVADAELREQMVGFMGQESMHAESHNQATWEFLQRHGIDPEPILTEAEYLFDRAIARLDTLPETLRHRVVVQMLAGIAGIEHFTAIGGDWLLNQDFDALGADPALTDLFRWHGAEEVEHRSVAWNVARYFGARRPRLLAFYLATSVGLPVSLIAIAWWLIRQDPTMANMSPPAVVVHVNRGMRRGVLPRWRLIGRGFAQFVRPDFDPEEIGDTAQAVAYLAKSPAAKLAHAS
ncbi:metal-dependent hydrolase [Nocardia huaxiensis]|uniref:Metal-dependent hydrolase n=1 Tax=Nocardia huaxiensis TaxID=2755382 RepID=A0A7D6ZDZ5_9NOCA|nr:metal-dependent hydrolase [Nocardia huaxiensis]QLY27867.1 metal-dependent hydrolase [Nocardia huaxiensis]UFS98735.1 metal-dependent hydrolase [Nocardia huaxiensis]